MIIAGNRDANERATAGGTPSGILITNFSLPTKRVKTSATTIPTINATNKPEEFIPLVAAPKVKKEATDTTPAPTGSLP